MHIIDNENGDFWKNEDRLKTTNKYLKRLRYVKRNQRQRIIKSYNKAFATFLNVILEDEFSCPIKTGKHKDIRAIYQWSKQILE